MFFSLRFEIIITPALLVGCVPLLASCARKEVRGNGLNKKSDYHYNNRKPTTYIAFLQLELCR